MAGDDVVPYTRSGDHILFSLEGEVIEFAPAAEIEAILAALAEPDTAPDAEPGDAPGDEPNDEPNDEPGDAPNDEPGDEPNDEPGDVPNDEPAPGTDVTEEPPAITEDVLMGSWTLTHTRFMGADVPVDQKSTTLSLVFNEDGSVVELVDGSPNELEWVIREDGKVVVMEADVEKYVLTFDGTALIAETGIEGVENIFEKDA